MVLCSRVNYRRLIILLVLFLFADNLIYADNSALDKFKKAKTWLYQLQDINFNKVVKSDFDILVTDYSWDGSKEKEYRSGQIPRLKKLTGIVALSYISIGEAEDYRFYWNSDWQVGEPSFIFGENKNWAGNFKVKYWDKDWKKIVYQYIDRIIDEGFDGLYIDLVDAYQYFEKKYPQARDYMIDFVIEIADYCRNEKGRKDFIIVPQNAPELVTAKRYLKVIDGIAQEETYFMATDIPSNETAYNEKYLDIALKAGKKVLTADYCVDDKNIDRVYKLARDKGYIPYCTVVDLDRFIEHR